MEVADYGISLRSWAGFELRLDTGRKWLIMVPVFVRRDLGGVMDRLEVGEYSSSVVEVVGHDASLRSWVGFRWGPCK